jgi:agmatine/peptidylarginine deiminase
MRRLRVPLGLLLGLVGAAVVLAIAGSRPSDQARSRATLLSDCDGAIQEITIHYVIEAGDVVGRAYREFLQRLPRVVVVYVVCPDHAAFEDLVARVGPTDCRMKAIAVGHPITTWSRDRWVSLEGDAGTSTLLYCPRNEKSVEIWPARAGDAQVGQDLARTLRPRVECRRSSLFFDGGDFVADSHCAFVTPDVLLRNLQQTVYTRDELQRQLEAALNRRVVLLKDAPPYHAGMFMMAVGEQTMIVGDPAEAERILAEAGHVDANRLLSPSGPDFSDEMIAQFDAVADQCREAGYRVIRIPVAPGRDGRTYLTYVNVIIDHRDGQRIVYMPVYDGADNLNQAAAEVWASAGYHVVEVNCTACYRHYGSLRCLVNVLRRH